MSRAVGAVDLMLWCWLDGLDALVPDELKRLQTPLLRAFKTRASECPTIHKRVETRKERYLGLAPGF